MTIPRIGITPGDPGGVGPEVLAKALAGAAALPPAQFIIFGNSLVLRDAEKIVGASLGVKGWTDAVPRDEPGIFLRRVKTPLRKIIRGAPSRACGEASFLFFQEAVEEARDGKVDAVATAPISKTAWSLAGIAWRGHTEYLEHLYPGAIMSFWSDRLRVALLSHHLPLLEAVGRVKKAALVEFSGLSKGAWKSACRGNTNTLFPG